MNIKTKLDELCNDMLELDVNETMDQIHMTDDDVMNAWYIFLSTIWNRYVHESMGKIPDEEIMEKMRIKWEELRAYVLDFTWFDTHEHYART